jgi:hypothetical protein
MKANPFGYFKTSAEVTGLSVMIYVRLTRYREIATDNLIYDSSDKTYRAAARFAPRFLDPDTDEVLSRLRLFAEGVAEDHSLIGSLSLGLAPVPARPVEPETLRVIIRAIREAR